MQHLVRRPSHVLLPADGVDAFIIPLAAHLGRATIANRNYLSLPAFIAETCDSLHQVVPRHRKAVDEKYSMIRTIFTQPMAGNPDNAGFRHPAIMVYIHPPGPPGSTLYIGMIDTGADLSRIDSAIADSYPPAGSKASLFTGISVVTPMVNAVVGLEDKTFCLNGAFPINPLRAAGLPYDAILGMDFIQHFNMQLEARTGIFKLTYLSQA